MKLHLERVRPAALAVVLLLCSLLTVSAPAAIVTVLNPAEYQAQDILSAGIGAYDVYNDQLAAWTGSSLEVFDLTGSTSSSLGAPGGYSGYISFATYDPGGSSVWVGFTTGGNVDDRIYQVDVNTGTWTQKATLAGNFDLAFSGGNAYVSGLNSGNWMDPNKIWLLDTSGSNSHTEVANVGGVSAGLDFDASGNLYYGLSAPTLDESLVRYSAAQIAAAILGSPLARGDAELLSILPTGANYPQGAAISDVAIDDAGNVLFNFNQTDTTDYASDFSYIALWNGTSGSGQNYTLLTQGAIPGGQWHTTLAAVGDVTQGGRFYQADWYAYPGLAEVTSLNSSPPPVGVPEPATLAILASGALALLVWRRRRG